MEQFGSLLKRLSLNISSQIKEKFCYITEQAPSYTGKIIDFSIPSDINFFYECLTSDKVKWDFEYNAVQEEVE
jgi:hypothetical protein